MDAECHACHRGHVLTTSPFAAAAVGSAKRTRPCVRRMMRGPTHVPEASRSALVRSMMLIVLARMRD